MAEKKAHEDKDVELKKYELGYHLVPSLGEDDLALRVADLQKAVAKIGGTVLSEGYPQSFILSYTMHKLRAGKWDRYDSSFFGWMRFEASSEGVEVLRDELDHNDQLVRYLLITLNEAAFAPPPAPRRKPMREVKTESKVLVKKRTENEKGEVSEVELDKQIKQLIS